jgi:hypothetical protein
MQSDGSDTGESQLSKYELKRLDNITRNKRLMQGLGLLTEHSEAKKKTLDIRKRKRDEAGTRRKNEYCEKIVENLNCNCRPRRSSR